MSRLGCREKGPKRSIFLQCFEAKRGHQSGRIAERGETKLSLRGEGEKGREEQGVGSWGLLLTGCVTKVGLFGL